MPAATMIAAAPLPASPPVSPPAPPPATTARHPPPPHLQITLNGGEYEAFSRVDGGFTFHDVKPGVYLLDVLSDEAMFSQVRKTGGGGVPRGTSPPFLLRDASDTALTPSTRTTCDPQVKINLPTDLEGKVRCLEYRYPGAPKQPTTYPLNLVAHTKIRYFEVRRAAPLLPHGSERRS